ncbi:cell division protein FtsA [Paenisporosarcina cavernae]|uniref:Cell division protein n=1 Tax=Paenisporosarcina cavernae TaxID=2320858 RepID=A0A385YWF9_9BACL|nr:cell division FtsA domain-containing protein [Paenisporosarcina cavernae]AYC29873.1 cell division protein [Paenisporosarcina cavernae]
MSEKLFALDIGTRSIVGIILEESEGKYHVRDLVVEEHKERAMLDGQIHNVLAVADAINIVKNKLETTHGPLQKVSVAAAGRALKTEQAFVEISIENRPLFSEEDVNRLEIAAVQQAQSQLLQDESNTKQTHYYCVGYSVLFYRLDGEEIGSLVDQQGKVASVEVIATFLPRVVVESLMSALKRADLEMEGLTLEPIAAINVLIPTSMRRLNVALVDIGAGTSDIAITDRGTVVAYGMVPTAGDEITEALSDQFLLDFPLAEKVKRNLRTEEFVSIQDILGFDTDVASEEVIVQIEPAIRRLANEISIEILRLNNQQAPKAVMLVGGGSLTPKITTILAELLQLPENRVAIRGIDAIQSLTKEDHIPITPELVTPIGIAIAAKKAPIHYLSVRVNEQVVRLFELKEMTVGDAFLAANIKARNLYGKPGLAISIDVNGSAIHIPGEHGKPSEIFVNGKTATTKTFIQQHDEITILPGEDGANASVTVKSIIDDATIKTITVNGRMYVVEPTILINGKKETLDYVLKERDSVSFMPILTIEQALRKINREDLLQLLKPYQLTIDGKVTYFPEFTATMKVNTKVAKNSYPLEDNANIVIEAKNSSTARAIIESLGEKVMDGIRVKFQSEVVELSKEITSIYVREQKMKLEELIPTGTSIHLKKHPIEPWIFQDVFRFANWQLPNSVKGQIAILKNNEPSGFDSPIFGGDTLEIVFT